MIPFPLNALTRAIVTVAAVVLFAPPSAPAQGYGSAPTAAAGTVSSWPTGRKLVALTYDDGPHAKVTPELMDLLEKRKVPATFYLLGRSVQANPKLTAELVRRGFEVGNHSNTHPQLTKVGAGGTRRELKRTAELITTAAGSDVRIPTMRPPYGAHNAAVRGVCAEMGYPVILWDVDTNDWRKGVTAEKIVSTVVSQARDGSIILMHDRLPSTVPATARIIDELRARGFEFVTVSQLLAYPRATTGAKQTAPKTEQKAPDKTPAASRPALRRPAAPAGDRTSAFPPPSPVR